MSHQICSSRWSRERGHSLLVAGGNNNQLDFLLSDEKSPPEREHEQTSGRTPHPSLTSPPGAGRPRSSRLDIRCGAVPSLEDASRSRRSSSLRLIDLHATHCAAPSHFLPISSLFSSSAIIPSDLSPPNCWFLSGVPSEAPFRSLLHEYPPPDLFNTRALISRHLCLESVFVMMIS